LRALLVVVLVLLVAAGAALLVRNLRPSPPAPTVEPLPAKLPLEPSVVPEKQGTVLFLDPKSNLLKPVSVPLPEGDLSPEEEAVTALLNARAPDGLVTAIPKGARLLGLRREGKRVTVDLSKEFAEGLPEGSDAGYLTLMQVVNTLTSLEGVEEVSFFIEGKRMRALGQTDLRQPLKGDESLIARQGS